MILAPERITPGGKLYVERVKSGMDRTALITKLCEEAGISFQDVTTQYGFRRRESISHRRFRVMWYLRKVYGWTLPEIADSLGGMNNKSVLHGVNRYADMIKNGTYLYGTPKGRDNNGDI